MSLGLSLRGLFSRMDVDQNPTVTQRHPWSVPPDPSRWQKRLSNKMAARPAVEPISVIHPVTWVVRTLRMVGI